MSKFRFTLAALLLCVLSTTVQAATVSFNWDDGTNGQVVSTDTFIPTDFNNGISTFNPIANASTVTLGGYGFAHSHSGYTNITLDALINGSWSTIWSDALTPWNEEVELGQIGLLNLPVGVLSGFAFHSSYPVSFAFHGMNGLNFSISSATPEPHEWALILLALAGTAVFMRQRQLKVI